MTDKLKGFLERHNYKITAINTILIIIGIAIGTGAFLGFAFFSKKNENKLWDCNTHFFNEFIRSLKAKEVDLSAMSQRYCLKDIGFTS